MSASFRIRVVMGKSEVYRGLQLAFWCEHLKKPNVESLAERKSRAKTYISVPMEDKKAFRDYLLRHEIHKILNLIYTPKNSLQEESLDLEQEDSWRELHVGMGKTLRSIADAAFSASSSSSSSSSSAVTGMAIEKIKGDAKASSRASAPAAHNSRTKTSMQRNEAAKLQEDPIQRPRSDSVSTISSGSKRLRQGPPSIYGVDNSAGLSFNEDESLFSIERIVVGRDEATQFYNSPYVHYWNVQRVIMIDHNSKELMLCTPMKAAAYYYKRHLVVPAGNQQNDNPTRGEDNAYLLGIDRVDGIPSDDLDKAFNELYTRLQGSIKWYNDINELEVKEEGKDAFYISGFSEQGGWGKFLYNMISPKAKWVSIMTGRIRNSNHPKVKQRTANDTYDLLFDDQDAELILGEPRRFPRVIENDLDGLQFRGGFAVVEIDNEDFLISPYAGKGHFNRNTRAVINEKTWCLKVHQKDYTQIPRTFESSDLES